jgi:hypothetical protein
VNNSVYGTKVLCVAKDGKNGKTTTWCPALPFVCSQPASCLQLDNHHGILTHEALSKTACLAKADDRFTVKWCPFETGAPTAAPTQGPSAVPTLGPTASPTSADVLGCMYDTAANYNENATIDDGSCDFAELGCTYVAAANYNKKATVDDRSCVFEPATVSGGLCLSGVNASELPEIMKKLKNRISKVTKVPTSNIKIVESTGSCTRRLQDSLLSGRILQATSSRYEYAITTEAKRADFVVGVLSTDLQTALEEGDDLTVESADPPQLEDSCTECTDNYQCDSGFCEFGSGGGTRKLRFGNTMQSGCCRAL